MDSHQDYERIVLWCNIWILDEKNKSRNLLFSPGLYYLKPGFGWISGGLWQDYAGLSLLQPLTTKI